MLSLVIGISNQTRKKKGATSASMEHNPLDEINSHLQYVVISDIIGEFQGAMEHTAGLTTV